MKKVFSLALSAAMLFSMTTAAFAADNEVHAEGDNILGEAQTDVKVSVTKSQEELQNILVATVPMNLSISVDTKGNVTVPTEAQIVNNSNRNISITAIKMDRTSSSDAPWGNNFEIGSYDQAYGADGNCFGLSLRGDTANTLTSGTAVFDLAGGNWDISANGTLPLNVNAAFGEQMYSNGTVSDADLATITFTIAFAD